MRSYIGGGWSSSIICISYLTDFIFEINILVSKIPLLVVHLVDEVDHTCQCMHRINSTFQKLCVFG
mgnify:FL=1